jgi:hypothetical protein
MAVADDLALLDRIAANDFGHLVANALGKEESEDRGDSVISWQEVVVLTECDSGLGPHIAGVRPVRGVNARIVLVLLEFRAVELYAIPPFLKVSALHVGCVERGEPDVEDTAFCIEIVPNDHKPGPGLNEVRRVALEDSRVRTDVADLQIVCGREVGNALAGYEDDGAVLSRLPKRVLQGEPCPEFLLAL